MQCQHDVLIKTLTTYNSDFSEKAFKDDYLIEKKLMSFSFIIIGKIAEVKRYLKN